MSADTLKRVLKACRMRRQCIQQVPSNHPPQTDDQRKRIALDILKEIGTAGRIEPDYMDEPGSTLVPPVPYTWKVQNVLLEFSIRQSKDCNVFVFIHR